MKLILTEAQIKEILRNEYIKNYDPNIEKILETRGSFPKQYEMASNIFYYLRFTPEYVDKNGKKYILINLSKGLPEWIKNLVVIAEIHQTVMNKCQGLTYNIEYVDKAIKTATIKLDLYYHEYITENQPRIIAALAHELLHLYEYYISTKENEEEPSSQYTPMMAYAEKTGYAKLLNWLRNQNDKDKNSWQFRFLYDIYVCHPHEINAFVSSVSSELLEKFTTVSNFKENLKETQAYQIYKKILDNDLPTFKSVSRQDKHNLFDSISNLDLYKKETQGKGTWFDAMVKMIEKRSKYAIKAICRNASLYYENLRSGLVDYPL